MLESECDTENLHRASCFHARLESFFKKAGHLAASHRHVDLTLLLLSGKHLVGKVIVCLRRGFDITWIDEEMRHWRS
jgi:hypothetical protein